MSHEKLPGIGTGAEPTVGVVILNWNGLALTVDTLESLAAVDFPQGQMRVYLVDNGSTDGSAEALGGRPGLVFLPQPLNRGFAGGSNAGIRKALADGCDYILLLNNDVLLHPAFLARLLAWAESNPKAGLISPKIRYAQPENLLWYGGGDLPWPRMLGGMTTNEEDRGQRDQARIVGFATGCCLLVRRQVFERVGLLDEDYSFYHEDVDFCVRAARAGFEVWYVPHSLIWHRVSQSTQHNSSLQTFLFNRNRMIFFRKHIRGGRLVPVVVLEILRWLRFVLTALANRRPGQARSYTAGVIDGLRAPLRHKF